jgi:hypothetical protein
VNIIPAKQIQAGNDGTKFNLHIASKCDGSSVEEFFPSEAGDH